MGEFAKEKVLSLAKQVQQKKISKKIEKELSVQIALIGEPILRRALETSFWGRTSDKKTVLKRQQEQLKQRLMEIEQELNRTK